ncbi:DUF3040 domain-containing protein [Actinomadura coerulea]|uniref:DUF3040 domain-containing protein n=1 Tax=Actinomadura coerulea TaxID=46159 RepID=A0A7X0KXZ6_9ACTN|nr:DUF3040 domain-containing protein [Actinomadura coerulea]MBB6394862.1 hypothetical protein [Actinomadura coerulea]GGQ31533.1 hypothetical protein GCM10010187_55510 [Actinomadura coerulea]
MALSMEEQRILGQIEVRLKEDDPRLAQRLARLGTPRARRARTIVLAAAAVIIVLAAIGAGIAAAIL